MPEPPSTNTSQQDVDSLTLLRVQLEGRLDECAKFIERGVQIVDPMTTYLEPGVQIGGGTIVYPNTTVSGESIIGERCRIGPNAVIFDSRIGDDVTVFASVLESADVEPGVDIGPFSHLRPGAYLEQDVHIGNYVEIKDTRIGSGTKVGHFSYLGDAKVGANVNIGAGTVTCNYDGETKHETLIEEEAFIGSDTMLVAPVKVGKGARTGAGAVVTKNVDPGARVAGVPARVAPSVSAQKKVRKKRGQR
jgi:bifunctional UDP-N-acetylglucosamine pyrophosphorylase/glucosamine-1-phosphate N-acetyltransferase